MSMQYYGSGWKMFGSEPQMVLARTRVQIPAVLSLMFLMVFMVACFLARFFAFFVFLVVVGFCIFHFLVVFWFVFL
jgi:hypothetical protein